MDWESLYCPNRHCRYYGRPFLQGLLVKNGSSHGQKQARCKACETPVSIRYGTAYLDLHADPAIFEMAVRASIMASATPFCFCTTQKHLTVKRLRSSMVYGMITPILL